MSQPSTLATTPQVNIHDNNIFRIITIIRYELAHSDVDDIAVDVEHF